MKRAEQRRRQRQRRPTPQPFLGEAEKPAAQHDFLGKPRHDRNADNRDQHADVVIADHTIAPERGDHSDDSRKQHQQSRRIAHDPEEGVGWSGFVHGIASRLRQVCCYGVLLKSNGLLSRCGWAMYGSSEQGVEMIRTLKLFGCALLLGAAASAPRPAAIPVTVATSVGDHQAGRLIVFVERVKPRTKPSASVDFDPFSPTGATIAAREVTDLRPNRAATVDADTDAFPAPLATLAPGRYRIQAVLDRNHDYAYNGRGPGDPVSPVVTVNHPGAIPTLTLARVVPAAEPAPSADLAKYYPLVRG